MTMEMQRAVQRLVDLRSQLANEIEALRGRIAGIDTAVELLKKPSVNVDARPASSETVTDFLVHLLEDAGAKGLNAKIAIDLAAQRGVMLNQQSVSSLLSRLKKTGSVVYDRRRYRLPKFAPGLLAANTTEQQSEAA